MKKKLYNTEIKENLTGVGGEIEFEVKNRKNTETLDNSQRHQERISKESARNQQSINEVSAKYQQKIISETPTIYDSIRAITAKIHGEIENLSNGASKRKVIEKLGNIKENLKEYPLDAKDELEVWLDFLGTIKYLQKTAKKRAKVLKNNKQTYETETLSAAEYLAQNKKIVKLLSKNEFFIRFFSKPLANGTKFKTIISNWIDFREKGINNEFLKFLSKYTKQEVGAKKLKKILDAMYEQSTWISRFFVRLTKLQRWFIFSLVPAAIVLILASAVYKNLPVSAVHQTAQDSVIETTRVEQSSVQPLPTKQPKQQIADETLDQRLDRLINQYNKKVAPPIYEARRKRIKYWIIEELDIANTVNDNYLKTLISEGHFRKFDKLFVR